MSLQKLKKLDNLKELSFNNHKMYIHQEHRFVLPLIVHSQNLGLIPKPSTMILFDYHPDSRKPKNLNQIIKMRQDGISFDSFIKFCENEFSKNDDDWLIAGIELGLLNDVVIFGVDHKFDKFDNDTYEDHNNVKHKIIFNHGHPGDSLKYQGNLSDTARSDELIKLWDILGWELIPQKGFDFKNHFNNKIILNFDLDCFVVRWEEYLFPWPDEIFNDKYFRVVTNSWSTNGWTGNKFIQKLLKKAGIITIATEPNCCGSVEKSIEVFSKVNKYLFNNQLKVNF